MRIFLLMMIVSVVGLGCAQMRYSGRYQEVKIESEPTGAQVLVEGKIGSLTPVAVRTEDGTELAYSSPMQLKTPVVVILDKDCEQYSVRLASEGYPEYEKVLKTRFAFHPYLIVLFPIVPFWSDYEIKRFDDVIVDFAAYKEQLESEELGQAEKDLGVAQAAFEEKSAELDGVATALEEKEKALEEARKETSDLEEELNVAEKVLEKAEEEKTEELKATCEDLKKKLTAAQEAVKGLEEALDDLQKRGEKLTGEKTAAQELLENVRLRYEEFEKIRREKQKDEEPESPEEKPEDTGKESSN